MLKSERYCPVRAMQCPLESKIKTKTQFAFIAIPSNEEWMDSRETIKAVLNENGVFPYVAQEDITAGKDIFCKICERIISSNFGIIELTEKNPNVMLEFGLMLGNQKPVFMLYNKAIAKNVGAHVPTDITALERIEYFNQKELKEQLSKGLQAHLERLNLTVEPSGSKVFSEASSEDLDFILEALKSDNEVKRQEGITDLNLISYQKRVVHDRRVLIAIRKLLDDEENNIRIVTLETLRIILLVEDETERKIISNEFLQKICEMSVNSDQSINLRERAFTVLEEIRDPLIIDVAYKVMHEINNVDWTRLSNYVMRCLRVFYRGSYRNAITAQLYAMLDDPTMQSRASNILGQLRQN